MILPEKSSLSNIILIGMAGAGKSTVGLRLARSLGRPFIDTDTLIAQAYNSSLQKVLDKLGRRQFQVREEKTLLSVNVRHTIIATGGSAVYSSPGMRHLQTTGLMVWLDVPLPELEARVNNLHSRGLVNPEGTGFADLYRKRLELYHRFAELRIDCRNLGVEETVQSIISQTGNALPDNSQLPSTP
jgi:shikimate kinase